MEYFAHDYRTSLAVAMTAGQTTLTPASLVGAPLALPFRVRVGDELVRVTGNLAGPAWAVERGIEGTTATAHAIGTPVDHVITAGMLADLWAAGGGAGLPPVGDAGDVLTVVAGEWAPAPPGGGGGGGSDTPPLIANYTWVNQGTAFANETAVGLHLFMPPAAGEVLRMLQRDVPAAPYTVTLKILASLPSANYAFAGLALRDNVAGNGLMFGLKFEGAWYLNVQPFNSSHTASGAHVVLRPQPPPCPVWLRLRDDGTNRHFEFSVDGMSWLVVLQQGRTVTVTPTHYALAISPGQATFPVVATYADLEVA